MSNASHAQILNYVQMTDRIATSGQPTREEFALIQAEGYGSVINLAMPDSDQAVPGEAALVTGLGLNYFHIPVPFASPRPEHVRIFCNLLRSLEELEDHRVWVHCILNYRVSAFVYHYLRLVRDFQEKDARSPIFGVWAPDAVWSGLLAWDRERVGI
ncbi:MAG: protein tyrosine phosphatase family protein [Leptospirales bacterium]|jgi:protein tyrosine phosphatase (PTP) superfamily phosphohydrolase (DUF442 family)